MPNAEGAVGSGGTDARADQSSTRQAGRGRIRSGVSAGAGPRVLISHAGPDTEWAEWVAWHLNQAGYQVELDRWDWETGANFVFKMSKALDAADLVAAVWSRAYFEPGRFTGDEWTSVLAARGKLVPLRIEDVTPPTLLRPLLYKDLNFRQQPESAAAEKPAPRVAW
jgi:TIR domain